MKKSVILLLILLLLPIYVQAQQGESDWYQDVLEMIEDGRSSAAKITLDGVASRKALMSDSVERVDYDMHLADSYERLGKSKQSRDYFSKAMNDALKIRNSRDKIETSIAVLKLRSETDDIASSQLLLQSSLAAKLLPFISKNRDVSYVEPYVKQFAQASRRKYMD